MGSVVFSPFVLIGLILDSTSIRETEMVNYSVVCLGALLLVSVSTSVVAQSPAPASLAPDSAPAPAPHLVNLTDLLSVAGPFHTFLNYLVQTKVIDTFQNQANNTDQGITIFVPTDAAFAALKKPSLANLTQDQLKSLLLYHALPKYYSLAEFGNLSKNNPVSTLAGGQYTLNFSDASGMIRVNSGWTNPKISSSVIATRPVAVYQIDHPLLPVAIFGAAPPPAPASAPAPLSGTPSDTPRSFGSPASSPPSELPVPKNSASLRIQFAAIGQAVFAITAGLVLLF